MLASSAGIVKQRKNTYNWQPFQVLVLKCQRNNNVFLVFPVQTEKALLGLTPLVKEEEKN